MAIWQDINGDDARKKVPGMQNQHNMAVTTTGRLSSIWAESSTNHRWEYSKWSMCTCEARSANTVR